MGGIPAGGAGPPPPGGTSGTSSAVKSIVAACSVLASWCSITASRRARRPSTSVATSRTARSPARQLKEFGCLFGGCVAAHRTSDAGQRAPLTDCDRVREVQNRVVRSRASFYASPRPPLLGEQGQQQSASATRGLARAQLVARCKALSSTHYRGTVTPRFRLALQQVLQQRFTQEQHAIDAP